MSDIMPQQPQQQANQLTEEAKKLEKEGKFAEAARMYKQAYDLRQQSFAASRYLHCARKSGVAGAQEAAKNARQIAAAFSTDKYVINEYVWAIYDGYLKRPEGSQSDEDDPGNDEDISDSEITSVAFPMMERAARRILELTAEILPRKLAVFAICKEAKRLKKWDLMYWFAQQLDPKQLSTEQTEYNGRRLTSDYQKWLYSMARSLLELQRYEECITYAREGIEKFPDGSLHFQRWEALAKIYSGQVEEGLSQLEYIDVRFPKQWYIQADIGRAYSRLQKYEDAWLWFCKAAAAQGDIKGRVLVLGSMVDVLPRLENWQATYDQLLLIWAIEVSQSSEQRAARTRQRILEFRKHHAEHITANVGEVENNAPTISAALKPCRACWQQTINASRPRSKGKIESLNEEKQFGFIINESGKIHFKFKALAMREQPVVGMEVEFETEQAFDLKRGQQSTTAVNIRLVKTTG